MDNNEDNLIKQYPIYQYKGLSYIILHETKIKTSGVWTPAIIYKCLYKNKDGMIWVRTKDEFFEKFKRKK